MSGQSAVNHGSSADAGNANANASLLFYAIDASCFSAGQLFTMQHKDCLTVHETCVVLTKQAILNVEKDGAPFQNFPSLESNLITARLSVNMSR